MYKIERFGNLTLPHTNPVQDQSAGPARMQLFDLPGGGAWDVLGDEQAPSGARTLTKSCTIFDTDESALLTTVRSLRSYLGKKMPLYRRAYATDEVDWAWARLARVGSTRRVGDKFQLNVDLEFAILSPVWNGEKHGDDWYLDSGEGLDTGLIVDAGADDTIILTTGTDTGTINNGGNANVRNPTITITPGTTTPITYLRIKRLVDGAAVEDIQVSTDLYINCTLRINCGAKTVKIEGPDWAASTAYVSNYGVIGTGSDGIERQYYVSVAGTSGSTEPTWPTSGTVVDGTVTWTLVDIADRYEVFIYAVGHTTDAWISLEPGDNSIQVIRTGGAAGGDADPQCTFHFYDGWQ